MIFAATATLVIILSPPPPPQCSDPVFSRTNPGICQGDYSTPFPDFSTGGGGNGGGLIGHILHAIGGLL